MTFICVLSPPLISAEVIPSIDSNLTWTVSSAYFIMSSELPSPLTTICAMACAFISIFKILGVSTSSGSVIFTVSILLLMSLSFSSTSVPYSNCATTIDTPSLDLETVVFTFEIDERLFSIGSDIWSSISSGPAPDHWVITKATGTSISGIKLAGILLYPIPPNINTTKNTIIIVRGRLTEVFVILIILVLLYYRK